MDCQNMCKLAECNGVQILNVVQFIVESSTYLLNTVGCYGYWLIDYVFFYFPFFVLSISEFGVVMGIVE